MCIATAGINSHSLTFLKADCGVTEKHKVKSNLDDFTGKKYIYIKMNTFPQNFFFLSNYCQKEKKKKTSKQASGAIIRLNGDLG